MPIFNIEGTLPQSKYEVPKGYTTDPLRKVALALLGFKSNGERNALGQITSWIPGYNVIANYAGERVAEGAARGNVADNMENTMAKAQIGLGVGTALLGSGVLKAGGTLLKAGGALKTVLGTIDSGAAVGLGKVSQDVIEGTSGVSGGISQDIMDTISNSAIQMAGGSSIDFSNLAKAQINPSLINKADTKSGKIDYTKFANPDIVGGIANLIQSRKSPDFSNDTKSYYLKY